MTSYDIVVGSIVMVGNVREERRKNYGPGIGWGSLKNKTIGQFGVVISTGTTYSGWQKALVSFSAPIDVSWQYLLKDLSVVDDDIVSEETMAKHLKIETATMTEKLKSKLKRVYAAMEDMEKTVEDLDKLVKRARK